jgi:hypothetical protein
MAAIGFSFTEIIIGPLGLGIWTLNDDNCVYLQVNSHKNGNDAIV